MDNVTVHTIGKGDIIDFGYYIKDRPKVCEKITNTDFKSFCQENAEFNIKYNITSAPGIYAFKKKSINKVIYVGQAINLKARLHNHGKDSFNKNTNSYNTRLANAFRKYGPQAFEIEILDVLDELDYQELDRLEKEFIKKYNTFQDPSCYNLTPGGQEGATASGLAARFKMNLETDKKVVNYIREFLLKAEIDAVYLTPESAIAALDIDGLTTNILIAINNGTGIYYDKNYNGTDLANKKKIYNFTRKKANIPVTSENTLCTVFVKDKAIIPKTISDENIARDHAGRPLVFIGCRDATRYIQQTFNWDTVDDRALLSMAKGTRATHSLIISQVGEITQVNFPTADYKKIADNSKAILQDIKFKQVFVNCIVAVDIDTAEEYRFKTTYGCALFLIEQGKIAQKDKNGVASTLKNLYIDKNKEYRGYMFFTEKIKLQDYYKLP